MPFLLLFFPEMISVMNQTRALPFCALRTRNLPALPSPVTDEGCMQKQSMGSLWVGQGRTAVHFVRSQRRPWVHTTVPPFGQLVNEVDTAARPPSLVPTNVRLWLQMIRPKAKLNKTPRMSAPWVRMGCKAQILAIAPAMARICNVADL